MLNRRCFLQNGNATMWWYRFRKYDTPHSRISRTNRESQSSARTWEATIQSSPKNTWLQYQIELEDDIRSQHPCSRKTPHKQIHSIRQSIDCLTCRRTRSSGSTLVFANHSQRSKSDCRTVLLKSRTNKSANWLDTRYRVASNSRWNETQPPSRWYAQHLAWEVQERRQKYSYWDLC